MLGFFSGILCFLALIYIIFFNVFGRKTSQRTFIDQYQPLRIPQVFLIK